MPRRKYTTNEKDFTDRPAAGFYRPSRCRRTQNNFKRAAHRQHERRRTGPEKNRFASPNCRTARLSKAAELKLNLIKKDRHTR